jgi:hypothetical protein
VTKPFREETLFDKLAEHLGVRYRYEEAGAVDESGEIGEERADVLTPERLAAVQGERVRELHEALSGGDFEAATEVAERIREHDEPLGSALIDEIRAFRLDELLSLLERLEGAER